jgi:hypothetical protein
LGRWPARITAILSQSGVRDKVSCVVAIAAEGGNAVKVIQPKGNREAREGYRV